MPQLDEEQLRRIEEEIERVRRRAEQDGILLPPEPPWHIFGDILAPG
jgi:hypothetical protein